MAIQDGALRTEAQKGTGNPQDGALRTEAQKELTGPQTHYLVGSTDSVSLLAGVLDVKKDIDGTIDSVSLLSGALGVKQQIVGSTDSISLLAGALGVFQQIEGTTDSISLLSGILDVLTKHLLESSSDSVSLLSGDIDITKSIIGSANSISLLTGEIIIDILLNSSTDSISLLTGLLNQIHLIIGSSDSISLLIGDLTVIPGGGGTTHQLEGSSDSVSLLSGFIDLTKDIKGSSNSISLLLGDINLINNLEGNSDAISESLGLLNQKHLILGQSDSISNLSGSLRVIRTIDFSGSIESISLLTGGIDLTKDIQGSTDSISLLSGILSGILPKIIAYSYIPVVEEVLITRLTEYLMEQCRWADQFPNFPQIRINNEYPWVPYMTSEKYFDEGWLDLRKVSETLFPSVTIMTNQDEKSPQVFVRMKQTVLLKEEFDDFKVQAATDGYLISPEALAEMETHFLTKDELYGINIVYQRRDTINIDITTDDQTNIKNRLYDLINLFLIGHGNVAIKQDLNIGIIDHSIAGSRSGTYNIDFGRILRGSSIQFGVDYNISQVYYDPSANLIDDIIVNGVGLGTQDPIVYTPETPSTPIVRDPVIAYSYIPVVEEILISRLTEYLMSYCKWADQFPNFPHVRINNEFPWVPYMTSERYFTEGWLDLKKVSETLFPSVTIVNSQDQKSPELFVAMNQTVLLKTEFDDFKIQAATDSYLISPEALAEMETHFLANDELYGINIIYQKQDVINIDITTDDQTNIKNRLYDLISLFLIGHGNTALKQDLDIQILDHSVTGNRSGSYNMDFGRMLRGSTISFNVDYKISQVFYDTSVNLISDILINT